MTDEIRLNQIVARHVVRLLSQELTNQNAFYGSRAGCTNIV